MASEAKDGYAVINRLLPGTPAELGGLLHPGDRILVQLQR
jgi:C-terminal processing protease CtpA/Prc